MTLSTESANLMNAAKARRVDAGLVSDYGNGHIVHHATPEWKAYRDAQRAARLEFKRGTLPLDVGATLHRLHMAAIDSTA